MIFKLPLKKKKKKKKKAQILFSDDVRPGSPLPKKHLETYFL